MSAVGRLVGGLLRPDACLACGAATAWPCCARCLPPQPAGVGPWWLAADPEVTLWALGPYRDALRAAVLAGKLHGQPAALTELGRRLGAAMAAAGAGADLVTFVAAGRAGQGATGSPRDHARRVADGVAGALDLPVATLLAPAGGHDLGRLWFMGADGWDPTAVVSNDNDDAAAVDIGTQLTVDPAGANFIFTVRSESGASLWMVDRQGNSVRPVTLPTPDEFDADPSFASR